MNFQNNMGNMNFPQNAFNTPAPNMGMNFNNNSNNMQQGGMNFNNMNQMNNNMQNQAFGNVDLNMNMGGQMTMGVNQPKVAETDWSADMIKANLTMFEGQSETVKRNALGKLMYAKVIEVHPVIANNEDLVSKVTAILIDFETFKVIEIVNNLSNNEEMIKNIEEAVSIIKDGTSN